jgi:PAS domain S-box-containing protein
MKILHLEDDARDAALVRAILDTELPGCAITLVVTKTDFLAALASGGHELILSDFKLPGFSGLEALQLVCVHAPDVPFIFVSGTIGEERAIEAVQAGAADYVIKDRMMRLPVAIQRALREREERRRRRHSEEEVHRSHATLNTIFEEAADALVVVDRQGRITRVNRVAERTFGYARAELLGQPVENLMPAAPGARHVAHRAAYQVAPRSRAMGGKMDLRGRRQDGTEFPVDIQLSPIETEEGSMVLATVRDITEKKKLEEQFLRAQRLESLGMLAAGIAHDLNNILAPVLMGAPLLRFRTTHPGDLRVLDTVEKSAERGAALVRQILSFAHGTSNEKKLIQARHLLRDIAELMAQSFPKSIQLDDEVPNDLWPILGNPTQLHQVLLNLCVNARDAMPSGGTLRLRAENLRLDEKAAQDIPEAYSGPYLVLEVTDTGTGIPPEILTHIWEPFFTTKGEGKGTGLGLATVRGIAANHGGFVTLDSELGRGTTFRIFLPAAEEPAASGRPADSVHPFLPRGQGELVLIVDDEVSVCDLIKVLLTRHGYRVLVAGNGVEAIAYFVPRAAEIALVITDLNMPEMGGADLARALPRLNPAVRILFTSGAGSNGSGKSAPVPGRVLKKPFTGEELLTCVHETLTAAPAVR